ncbi:NmrA family NAD(P)-binding protein [Marinomonas aquiplantarum]|uniref:Putative NAD(P)-binding protein n=1 Tax=Marinomonas aquiplantarum TaxID=491951 RepID=A0A366D1X8_9GAMM|nr:NmrA family NAD(P)-binding protein [Marinomonas aquiplantarum]RBO84051.1 putative NAD(P)-binding protein [Marinomonas aquiplantarum]
MSYIKKQIPSSILIFGAGNHIGKPMAKFIEKNAPQIKLRLVSSREEGIEPLRQEFPNAEIVQANYLDLPSMEAAVDGMEGIYMSVPNHLPFLPVTNNFVAAVKKSGTAIHIVRQVAMVPGYNYRLMPEAMKKMMGDEYPDLVTKRIYEENDLPTTFLNFGASFMDNFTTRAGRAIKEDKQLIWPPRKVPYIDANEIAEVAAQLLLSDNQGHIGQLHTLNNGQDNLRGHEVADIMSDVLGTNIDYVGNKEAFVKEYTRIFGPAAPMIWGFFEFEATYEEGWVLSDFVERMIGRKPKSLRTWLAENRDALMS